jgi:hypothetical protein
MNEFSELNFTPAVFESDKLVTPCSDCLSSTACTTIMNECVEANGSWDPESGFVADEGALKFEDVLDLSGVDMPQVGRITELMISYNNNSSKATIEAVHNDPSVGFGA